MTNKLVSIEEAVSRIPDGAAVSICGAWMQVPDKTLAGLERRFLAEGRPRGLTLVFAICPGGVENLPGIDRLAHEGLLRRTIGGSYPNAASPIRKLIADEKIEAYNLPSGLLVRWFREIGAGGPGVLTERGLGTFVDPRQTGGRMNACTRRDLLSIASLAGKEYLYLPSRPVDVAVIRGTTADQDGNISMEHESATLTAYVQAAAARSSGGIVIAQVKRTVAAGTLSPHAVKVPGILVDYVVVDPEQVQTAGVEYDPALCGEESAAPPEAASGSELEQFIAARAARHVRDGDVVVLGYGVSAYIPHQLISTGRFEKVRFAVEHGSIGGVPQAGYRFGNSVNPRMIADGASQFELFHGGCFDLAMLSFMQVDAAGRVNVHTLKGKPHLSVGIGGFADIAASAPRLVFIGGFTAGSQDVRVEGGRLKIVREGKSRKFVRELDGVSFDPAYSKAREIVYVTERATLAWTPAGLEVIDVAGGVDLDRDVLGQMEFTPRVREAVR
jgi:acyl CoA:acetate/3-ketoacid CoA transferase